MMAIFTEEIALSLLDMGFVLIEKSEYAWTFEDSVLLEEAVTKLVEGLS